ncbi:energy transducer TonB [Sphingomonas panacisoli]|uniref:Energy transducer TonB n=1 Tax=Sphingomonas panacisoli TaxID=1813879 RepID=A0A5B8LFF0_9SPHN|nr:energy transducer TonB [Sphingomonas panacisoli]QDZ06589.1 energy transducer TonB [Sphingomonas panacisoli]
MIALAVLMLAALAPGAQDTLPPIPAGLLGATAVTCVHVTDRGIVDQAFIVSSTGDPDNDRDVVAWVKQLRWDPATMGDAIRNRWFPMPIAFGPADPPKGPSICSPPAI